MNTFRLLSSSHSRLRIPAPTIATAPAGREPVSNIQRLAGDRIDSLFLATIQATEEAVTNALIAADTMTGADYWRS